MDKKVTIVGLGMIGGSLGMAIKKKNLARVIGLTRERSKCERAVALKAVDYASSNIKGIIQGADIIFICYPIHLIIPEIKKIIQFVKPGTIITDVGSTKEFIVSQAEKIMPKGVFFVGGHPMAGKEKTGIEEAEADLFNGRPYVLTRTKKTDGKALETLKVLVAKLGAKVSIMDPSEHDRVVAAISHMPVAIAASLIDSIDHAGKLKKQMMDLSSSGLRDTTRIASGDPFLGTDMFTTNKKAVLEAINNFKRSLNTVTALIRKGGTESIAQKLADVKKLRDSIFK